LRNKNYALKTFVYQGVNEYDFISSAVVPPQLLSLLLPLPLIQYKGEQFSKEKLFVTEKAKVLPSTPQRGLCLAGHTKV